MGAFLTPSSSTRCWPPPGKAPACLAPRGSGEPGHCQTAGRRNGPRSRPTAPPFVPAPGDVDSGMETKRGADKANEAIAHGRVAGPALCRRATGRSAAQLCPCSALQPSGHREGPSPSPPPDSERPDFQSEARHVTGTAATRKATVFHARQRRTITGDCHDWGWGGGTMGIWWGAAGTLHAGRAPLPPPKNHQALRVSGAEEPLPSSRGCCAL